MLTTFDGAVLIFLLTALLMSKITNLKQNINVISVQVAQFNYYYQRRWVLRYGNVVQFHTMLISGGTTGSVPAVILNVSGTRFLNMGT